MTGRLVQCDVGRRFRALTSGGPTQKAARAVISRAGRFAGAVLAGGESRRMGRDKAAIRVRGETLARRQVRVLRAAGAEPVFVVRRTGQRRVVVRGVQHVCDEFADVGPLAGLHAALKAARDSGARWLAVLAVDMPSIEPEWFRGLRVHCSTGRGALVRHADGFEPLAAIYPIDALASVERRVRRGEGSLQELLRALVRRKRMVVVMLPERERWRVENWNRPADRARARAKSFTS